MHGVCGEQSAKAFVGLGLMVGLASLHEAVVPARIRVLASSLGPPTFLFRVTQDRQVLRSAHANVHERLCITWVNSYIVLCSKR